MNDTNTPPAETLAPLLGDTPADLRRVILTPGQHIDDMGTTHRVGTHEFAGTVLAALPVTALFRFDTVVGELIGEAGKRRVHTVSDQRMRGIVDRHVRLSKWTKRKDEEPQQIYVACTRDWASLLVAQAAVSPYVPALSLLTPYPVFAGDFERVAPGWNPSLGIYYDEPPDLVGLEPAVSPSFDVIEDLVVDFPFADPASGHNAIGFVVTILVRPAIDGNVPFHLATAPLERTGKGKLIETCAGRLVLGANVPTIQMGTSEEEREKRITALILEGASVVHFDNLSADEVFDSPAFASLATTRIWKGRYLGTSKTPALPNNLIPVMSGNNTRASGEITKRVVPIKLQPTTDHPEDRDDFVHKDIDAYAAERRRMVLGTLIAFVELWKERRQPITDIRMGGFERWLQVVGGICRTAGATAWMTNYRDWVKRGDTFAADAEVLVGTWLSRYGQNPLTAKEILEIVKDTEIFSHVTARKPEGQLVCLAKSVLARLDSRPVDRFVVRGHGTGSSRRYRLDEVR